MTQRMTVVADRKGTPLAQGDRVRAREGTKGEYEAQVVEVFPDRPTAVTPGHWVKLSRDGGLGATPGTDIMSYLLEKIPQESADAAPQAQT